MYYEISSKVFKNKKAHLSGLMVYLFHAEYIVRLGTE
jgi:hypothetical protein